MTDAAEPTTYEVMATAPCPAFAWIGQTLSSCDGCGEPYWVHSHESRAAGGPFSGRSRRVVITRVQAERVRSKWG